MAAGGCSELVRRPWSVGSLTQAWRMTSRILRSLPQKPLSSFNVDHVASSSSHASRSQVIAEASSTCSACRAR